MYRQHRRLLAMVLLVTFLIVPAAAAQSAPRAAPANDNFSSATSIVIGKSYTALDISAATIDAGQPGLSDCGAATLHHSVWYTFTVADASSVFFSTYDSLFWTDPNAAPITDTVLVLFAGTTIGGLSQVECSDDSAGTIAELTANVSPGVTYYLAAGAFSTSSYTPESRLKLTSRMISTNLLPQNNSFEAPLTSADWKVKNGTGDTRLCSSPTYAAFVGICAFQFVGGPGENSKLKQAYALPASFLPRKGAQISVTALYRVYDTLALGPAKITFKILYSDGTPATVYSRSLAGAPAIGIYSGHSQMFYLASSKVSNIVVMVTFKSTSGVLMIDSPVVQYFASSITRDAAPLPAPLAAK